MFAIWILQLTIKLFLYPHQLFICFSTDYYYQTYYNEDSLPSKETELSAQQSQYVQASALNSKDKSQIGNDSYAGPDVTDCGNHRQEDHVTSDSQVIKAGER